MLIIYTYKFLHMPYNELSAQPVGIQCSYAGVTGFVDLYNLISGMR
jgi:hypothetical protein